MLRLDVEQMFSILLDMEAKNQKDKAVVLPSILKQLLQYAGKLIKLFICMPKKNINVF